MEAKLTTALEALAACKDEEWLVHAEIGGTATVDLGKYVSLRACLVWIQRLAPRHWTAAHLLRLQTVFKTLLSKATYFETQTTLGSALVVGYGSTALGGVTRRDFADCIAAAPEIRVCIADSEPCTISQLLQSNTWWPQFERSWSKLPSAAVHSEEKLLPLRESKTECAPTKPSSVALVAEATKSAAPIVKPSSVALVADAKSVAPTKTSSVALVADAKSAAPITKPSSVALIAEPASATPIVEEKSAALDAWLRLRACKRVTFALRCARPFVDWASGQTFAGVELDWVECNPRVALVTMQATPLVGNCWSARQTQLGVGDSFADDSRSTYGFVCADFQLPRYVAAVEAAWRAWQAQQLCEPEAPLYAVGKFKVQAIGVGAAPLLIVTSEAPAEWLEWHPDLGKAPEFRDRDSTAWLAELHKLIKDKAPLDRVRVVVE